MFPWTIIPSVCFQPHLALQMFSCSMRSNFCWISVCGSVELANERSLVCACLFAFLLTEKERASERERQRTSEKGNKWHTKCEWVLRFHNQLSMPPSMPREWSKILFQRCVFLFTFCRIFTRAHTHSERRKIVEKIVQSQLKIYCVSRVVIHMRSCPIQYTTLKAQSATICYVHAHTPSWQVETSFISVDFSSEKWRGEERARVCVCVSVRCMNVQAKGPIIFRLYDLYYFCLFAHNIINCMVELKWVRRRMTVVLCCVHFKYARDRAQRTAWWS